MNLTCIKSGFGCIEAQKSSFPSIFFYHKIYIDNSKVQEKDERSFPQSIKPNQSKTILHYKRIITDEDMYKISQKPESNSLT